MSTFKVPGVRLDKIEPHPDADRLDLTWVGDYQAIVQKGRFSPGDYSIYVPEQAVVPTDLLRENGFWDAEKDKGMLAGPNGDRVKAVRLRGIFSQGILINPFSEIEEGKDYALELGITKWIPPIPAHLSGVVFNTGLPGFSYTDIENIKAYPDALIEGERVIAAEKLHGTCAIFHCVFNPDTGDFDFFVSSKGLASKGLALQEADGKNFYWRIAKKYGLQEKLAEFCSVYCYSEATLFGEGLGVQDLKYGISGNDAEARFFDLRATFPVTGPRYYDHDSFLEHMVRMDLPFVPVLEVFDFNKHILDEITKGNETLSGTESHVREGVVVRPEKERSMMTLGRVILKSVNEDYLLRKSKDATEFE